MNILSLFDGIGCGQIALKRANIEFENYYSSEINKSAIYLTQSNYPSTIQLGDIKLWQNWKLPKIDLIIGGSPCQDLSVLNKLGKGLAGNKSNLFYFYAEVLNYYNPKYFLLENVKMKDVYKTIISEKLRCNPVLINSDLMSAQRRNRLYWTNIPFDLNIKDKNIFVKDILEENVSEEYYLSQDDIDEIKIKKLTKVFTTGSKKGKKEGSIEFPQSTNRKSLCLLASDGFKSKNRTTNFVDDGKGIRRFTPVEYERLQTMPDNYTDKLSINQRYKTIGNAWTIDIVSYIFSYIK